MTKRASAPPPEPTPAADHAAAAKTPGGRSGRPALRAGIGDIMAGVSLGGSAPAAPASGGAARPAAAPRHPIGSGIAFERVEDVYRMDPSRIVLEGPYVRQFVDDAAFQQLRQAVALERDIGQHLGVRVVGPPTNQRRVLVYGMRRWKAALAEGLERVPVRDYGAIGEEKALELQMLENEIRADPHPVDTALGFHLLARQPEWSRRRIAEVFDARKGYVSEMTRVGEAIAGLTDAERRGLYESDRVTVRAFQEIAKIKELSERRARLLALPHEAAVDDGRPPTPAAADGAPATVPVSATPRRRVGGPRDDETAVFHAKPLRDGRSFRVRWTNADLRRDGARIAEEFRARFLDEYQRLLERSAVLAAEGGAASGGGPDIAALVAEAAEDAARVDARIGGAPRGATGG